MNISHKLGNIWINEEILKRLSFSYEDLSRIITTMSCNKYKDYVSEIIDKDKENLIIQTIKKNPDSIKTYYMPIINNKTWVIEKYESLARLEIEWQIYNPNKFLDIISKNNLDNILTNKVLDNCISKIQNNPWINISININCNNIDNEQLLNRINNLVKNNEIEKWTLSIELLETIWTWKEHNIKLKKIIKDLQKNWIYVLLDDLWSVNSDLKRMIDLQNINIIKIDWWLTQWLSEINLPLEDNKSKEKRIKKACEIITFIVQIAEYQWQKVVAEYVSNKQIFEEIKRLWVNYSQWHYIWKAESDII